ncbi:hypothetical protein [Stieleria maiorica]|uniref:hypothetical protein n=1 Tax=Stieleria maiorica TaxID=2795974 RepID=UPI0011CAEB6C|nr:hypothetical protein [Stieleria maiorica]
MIGIVTADLNPKEDCAIVTLRAAKQRGFVPKPVAEAAKSSASQQFTREKPKPVTTSASIRRKIGCRNSGEGDAMGRLVLFVVALAFASRAGYTETPTSGSRRAVPSIPKGTVDVVLDTDAFNEVDDQFALAFAALSSHKINLLAVTAAPFRNQRSTSFADGVEKSYQEIVRILKLLGLPAEMAVRGSK